MDIDTPFIILALDPEELIVNDDEPSRYVYETTGAVVLLGEGATREVVGRFSLAYVDVFRAMHAGESISDVFESSLTTSGFYDSIYLDETDELHPDLESLLGGDLVYGDVLVLERLELLPAYRGKEIGLKVLQRLIERFSTGADLIALNAYPVQFDGGARLNDSWRLALALEAFGDDSERAGRKLRRYFRQVGFHHLGGSRHVFMKSSMLYDELSVDILHGSR